MRRVSGERDCSRSVRLEGGIGCQREKGRRVVREFGVVVTMNVSAVWEKMKEVDSRHRRSKTNNRRVGGSAAMTGCCHSLRT